MNTKSTNNAKHASNSLLLTHHSLLLTYPSLSTTYYLPIQLIQLCTADTTAL